MDPFEHDIGGLRGVAALGKRVLLRAARDVRRRWWVLPILAIVLVGVSWYVDIVSTLLWVVFLAFLLYGWDNRILGLAAILCLISCPILLALDIDATNPWASAWAEQMAVYAYFFLVMTVVLQIIELKRDANKIEKGKI